MGARSRSKSKRRRKETPSTLPVATGGEEDLISRLNDDLLVRILDLLPDARDDVRTHALSRRWRGLWTGVAALRFDSGSRPAVRSAAHAAKRYLAFVDDTLALCAEVKEPPAKDLEILFDTTEHKTKEIVAPSFQAAQRWIRYALQQEVKSLVLELRLPWRYFTDHHGSNNNAERPVLALDDLGSSAKLETMHLKLDGVKLRLPCSTTTVFASLADLSLEHMEFPANGDGGRFLSRLVSPACCPCLRKLRLVNLQGIQSLELRTPSLRVLHVKYCLDIEGFAVSALGQLEDLLFWAVLPLRIDDVHGHLSSVRSLNIRLQTHGEFLDDNEDDLNDGIIDLLQRCRLTRCLEVSLQVPQKKKPTNKQDLLCDNACQSKSQEFSLAHLQEVEFNNLIGTDCEFRCIQSILTRKTGIQRAAISFNPDYWLEDNKDVFKLMPPLDGGSWTMCADAKLSYKWRRYCT